MVAKRQLVLNLHKRNFRNIDIFRKLQNIGVGLRFIERINKRFKERGTIDIQKKTSRKRSVRIEKVNKQVKEKIRRNPWRNERKLAREHKMSDFCKRTILKYDLIVKPHRKRREHGFIIKNKKARVKRCKVLLRRHAKSNTSFSNFLQISLSHAWTNYHLRSWNNSSWCLGN